MIVSHAWTRWLAAFALAVSSASVSAMTQAVEPDLRPSDAAAAAPDALVSPSFVGMYRKVMEIDGAITRYSNKYGVDPALARAVCMFESGGNANLLSSAGARGYFQLMPSTFRLMQVPTNIEAGIKYLSQLIRQFRREDYALAAYNGGPGRVSRGRAMPLESLQYVLGVGHYRSVLKMYEPAVRAQAARLALTRSHAGDDFASLSARLGVPAIQLRLYNPFITDARLRGSSHTIAYPTSPVETLLETSDDGQRHYRTRIGDNYINLAIAFGVDVDDLRDANGLWRLQVLPSRMMLTIPARAPGRTDAVESASEPDVDRARPPVRLAVSRPPYSVHRVRRGDTLAGLARRYDTTVRAIQRANGMGRRTVIMAGQRLRIPR
jgi:LysM repeat protein